MGTNEARLLGRLHNKDKTIENLFVCSCGTTYWIKEVKEGMRQIMCDRCNRTHIIMKKERNYEIYHQDTLWQ